MSLPIDEAAWEKLREAVELVRGSFSLLAVEAPTPFIAVELARRFTTTGQHTHLDRLTGDQAVAHDWAVPTTSSVWIIAAEERDEGPLTRGWQRTFRGLNRIRNHLQRSFSGALLVVGPPWFHRLVWEEASDLWSGRDGPYKFPYPSALAGLPDRFEPWVGFRKTPPEIRGPTPEVTTFPELAVLLERRAHQLDAFGFKPEADIQRVRALAAQARYSDRRPLMERLRGFTEGRVAIRARLEWVALAEDCLNAAIWQGEIEELAALEAPDRLDCLMVHWEATALRLLQPALRRHLAAMGRFVEANAPGDWRVAWHLAGARLARTSFGDVEEAARQVDAAQAIGVEGEWADELDVEIEANRFADLSRPALVAAESWALLAERAEKVGRTATVMVCMDRQADLLDDGGDRTRAESIWQHLAASHQNQGDRQLELDTRLNLARILESRGELAEALRQVRAIRDGFETLGHIQGSAVADVDAANLIEARGGGREVLQVLESASAQFEALGDFSSRITALRSVARFWFRQREVDRALPLQREALALSDAIGDRGARASTLVEIARTLLVIGDTQEALRLALTARNESESFGRLHDIAVITNIIAEVLDAQGLHSEALGLLRESLANHERLGERRERGLILAKIAHVLQKKGNSNEALRLLRESLTELESIGAHRDAFSQNVDLANLLIPRGELDEAKRLLDRARATAENVGSRHGLAVVHIALGELALKRSQTREAIQHLRLAIRTGRELRQPHVVGHAGFHLLRTPGAVKATERFALIREVTAAFREIGREDLIEGLQPPPAKPSPPPRTRKR